MTASDVFSLAALAQAGDRLTKLTLTFSYGSTDPDVGLTLASATDYREVRYVTQYVLCSDAGSGPEAGPKVDASAVVADAGPGPDTGTQVVPDAGTKPDTALTPASADAAGGTTGTSTTGFAAGGNGCSLAGASTSGGFFALAPLLLAGRLRKRRGG